MILPKGRTVKYIIWRICERFGILPENFNENYTPWQQAEFIAYENVREMEDADEIKT